MTPIEVDFHGFGIEFLRTFVLALVLYHAAYFSSSYFLLNSTHGSIVEWEKLASALALVAQKSAISSPNDQHPYSKISRVTDGVLLPQVTRVSQCTELMARARWRLNLYSSRLKFVVFGIFLASTIASSQSLPILFTGRALVENSVAYAGIFTAVFGMLFIAFFNWTQTVEWNKFKAAVDFAQKVVSAYKV
jgi:hypothetical protein